MVHKVGVLGASGYTGAELLRLLHGHPEFEVAIVTADSNAGALVADLYPSLAPSYPELSYSASDPVALAGVEAVFCALPHGESQKFVPALHAGGARIFDLGADFRLTANDYEHWYGEVHSCPQLLDEFGYGLVELNRDHIRDARHVAVAGCYPTAVSLALAPLVSDGLIALDTLIADCASGVSGSGRGLKASSLFSEVDENFAAYGLLSHRHTAEMQMVLGNICTSEVKVLFTPHLAPMSRGILATCYARPKADGLSTDALIAKYRDFYAAETFVTVTANPPGTKATRGSNSVHITVRYDDRTRTIIAIAALDNLVKGASGQAIQCANLLFDLPESLGLPVLGLAP